MNKLYYENFVRSLNYPTDSSWQISNIEKFSNEITELFPYQVLALENVIKLLHFYYSNSKNRQLLYEKCVEGGLNSGAYNITEKNKKKNNELFSILSQFYDVKTQNGDKFIEAYNIFNRACFWMATASGKTIVLIKLIEILDTLQRSGAIDKREFLVLFPDSKIERQFTNAVKQYNYGKARQIKINSLKDYDEIKNEASLLDEIKVFSYRSDLLSDEEKAKKININAYDNEGKWFIFLDEAHKGDKSGDSKRQNYITQWSRDGFLFNFSATFTDAIDYTTTVFNYNLEKFIDDGYGKNIFVSNSYFDFKRSKEDLNSDNKQKQVLKSLIIHTLIKKTKQEGYYHDPLIVTLVDTVNKDDSDLYMFFKEIEKIAANKITVHAFEGAKEELKKELVSGTPYAIGDGKLRDSYSTDIDAITVKDVLKHTFNSSSHGKIEVLKGEASKEIALKLETSTSPFMLIKIGDANKFLKHKLGSNYVINNNFTKTNYFAELNNIGNKINILLGSRAFYEGWDSNRPNVMNFINIGSSDAKKFVLQSLGRGVRIQPEVAKINNRKRAKINESFKNELFETLFVFATNKNAVKSILDTLDEQKSAEEIEIKPLQKNKQIIALPLPEYKTDKNKRTEAKFYISDECLNKTVAYFNNFDKALFMLLFNASSEDYDFLKKSFKDKKMFTISQDYNYNNIKDCLFKIVQHIKQGQKYVNNIRAISDEDIIHFKHIKSLVNANETEKINNAIADSIKGSSINLTQILSDLQNKKITQEQAEKLISKLNAANSVNYNHGELQFLNMQEHYYAPIIFADNPNMSYLKHIVSVQSEIDFVKNLKSYVEKNEANIQSKWMFSKIDQTLDKVFIEYFNGKNNRYDKFYPDFIFWTMKNNKYSIFFIDPKGTQNVDYQFKIQGFQALFEENGKPKDFLFTNDGKKYQVTFYLYMVGDKNSVTAPFKKYWIDENDFSWLK